MRVDDPSVLPLTNSATLDPNDQVIGIDFSGGMASVVTQLNAALGAAPTCSSPTSGSTLRVLDDGAPNLSDVNAASVTTTVSSLTDGSAAAAAVHRRRHRPTPARSPRTVRSKGFAGRIPSTPRCSPTLAHHRLLDQPARRRRATPRVRLHPQPADERQLPLFAATGLGTASAPFKGTLLSFAQQFISEQGEAASAAKQLADGQDVVLNTLQQKMTATSGVNIDDEMAHLLALQNAYSANARVMSSSRRCTTR